eukprot:09885.XXX_418008_418142_1 [CDS] Oithona nana genome sequencing.
MQYNFWLLLGLSKSTFGSIEFFTDFNLFLFVLVLVFNLQSVAYF